MTDGQGMYYDRSVADFLQVSCFFRGLEIKEGFWPGHREYIIVGIIKGTGDWREEIFQ